MRYTVEGNVKLAIALMLTTALWGQPDYSSKDTCATLRAQRNHYGSANEIDRGQPRDELPLKPFVCQDTPKGPHVGAPEKKPAPKRKLPAAQAGAKGNA